MTPRIPIPPPTLDPLPLTSAQVTKLADLWGASSGHTGSRHGRTSTSWPGDSWSPTRITDQQQPWQWHHLLMAAGNFKRSAGPTHRPCGTRRIREPALLPPAQDHDPGKPCRDSKGDLRGPGHLVSPH